MSLLDKLFARLYPRIIKSSEDDWLRDARRELLAQAKGDVVEIGAGLGHNLDHYGPDVGTLTLTEAGEHMLAGLKKTVESSGRDAQVIHAPAQSLPLPDDSADYVVSTLVLCTAPQEASLAEVRRILRPDGTLLVLEHVAGHGKVERAQRRAQPFTKFFGRGCHVARHTRMALEAAGFDTSDVRDQWIDGEPKIYGPHIVGAARPRSF